MLSVDDAATANSQSTEGVFYFSIVAINNSKDSIGSYSKAQFSLLGYSDAFFKAPVFRE